MASGRALLRALPCAFAGVALCGAGSAPPDTTTVVETTATATVDVPPDRLFVAIDVEAEAGAPAPIGDADLELAVGRLVGAGIPGAAILKRYVTTPEARWKRVASGLDSRPYGVVLLSFRKPSRTELATLTGKATAAFEQPLSDGAFAQVGGAWYALDDCRDLRVAARKEALALARARAERLAGAAGLALDATGGERAAESADAPAPAPNADSRPDESEPSYLCGRDAVPDVPPPDIEPAQPAGEHGGGVEEESTITIGWPTLVLGEPNPLIPLQGLTSLGTDAPAGSEAAAEPIAPGTLRARASVSTADLPPVGGCRYDRALSGALALAAQRAALAGRAVGLVPDRPLSIVDATNYRAACPGRSQEGPEIARIDETFAASGAPNGWGAAHMAATGSSELRVAADLAHFTATFSSAVPWDVSRQQLSSAGADPTTLKVLSGGAPGVEGYVRHPTAAVMEAIDRALVSLSAPANPPDRTYAYALDSCSALDERVLRAAIDAARGAARSAAARRGVRLHAVTAIDAGPIRVRNCGPHVLAKLAMLPVNENEAATPSTYPSVTADGTVRLLFSLLTR